MTLEAFRADARTQLERGNVQAGDNYIVDHRDRSVYVFSVWANVFAIAFDRRWDRTDHDYQDAYRDACGYRRAGSTVHVARE